MKKLVTIFIIFCLGSIKTNAQETFSLFYTNPFYEFGGASGHIVHILEDTIFVSTTIVDADFDTVGYLMKFTESGELVDSIKLIPSIDSLWVNIGRYGGNILKDDQIIMPFIEFDNFNPELNIYSLLNYSHVNKQEIWKKNIDIDTNRRHVYRKAIEHLDGYSIVGIITDSAQITGYDELRGIVTHTDSLGDVQWFQTYDNVSEMFFAEQTFDGGLILGFQHYVGNGGFDSHDAAIIRTDSSGNELWRHHFGGEGGEGFITPVIQLMDSSYLVFNIDEELEGFGFFRGPYWVKRLVDDPSTTDGFTIVQDKIFDYRDYSKMITGVRQLSDSNIVIIGYNGRHLPETGALQRNRGFIMKMDNNLDSIWSYFYGYTEEAVLGYHRFHDFEIMPDGGFVITGMVKYPSNHPIWPSVEQLWLVRLDEFGCLEPGCQYVGLEEINIGLENTMLLYPNPVRSGSLINIQFSEQAGMNMPYTNEETTLIMYDQQGREVFRHNIPPTGSQDAFELKLSVNNLPPGIYSIQWVNLSSTSGAKWYDAVQVVVG